MTSKTVETVPARPVPGGRPGRKTGRPAGAGRGAGRWKKLPGVAGLTLVYVVVAALILPPILYLVYGAVRSGPPGSDATFTLANLRTVFGSAEVVRPLLNTVKIAVLVAVISVILGAVLAFVVARTDIPAPRLWELLISAPFYLSPMVLTLAVIAALGGPGYAQPIFDALGIDDPPDIYSFFGIAVVLTIWMSSYCFLYFRGPMRSLNLELSEAARSLGGGFFRSTVRLQGRLLLPTALAGGVMVFALVAETFSVPALLGAQNYPTVATEIYFATTYFPARSNQAAAYALLLMAVAGLGLALYAAISRNAHRYVSSSGKARSSGPIRLGAMRWPMVVLLAGYGCTVTIGPVVSLVLASLQPFVNPSISPKNLTLDNYRTVFSGSGWAALRNTLFLAIAASVLVLAVGFAVAYVRRLTSARGRATLEFMATITVAIPGLALGIGMLWAYIRFPAVIYGSVWILLVGYVARWTSQGVRMVDAGLAPISGDVNDAARVLGAGTARRIRTILLPLVARSVGAGLVVVFILVVNELPVTIFLYSPRSETLSVQLFNSLAMAGASQAAVYGVILVGLTVLLSPFLLLKRRGEDGAQPGLGG
ncbi:ABC transporter permease [Rhizomonospora bruguierae]|uniref:ABC transporter permease n=1 Tax=Rhizomonospora bruguierae TaxID=1581705 RepID=UPI001BCFB4B3|nr:iron ABC transporter permease [Micromonospora sp. NBRC 107566]